MTNTAIINVTNVTADAVLTLKPKQFWELPSDVLTAVAPLLRAKAKEAEAVYRAANRLAEEEPALAAALLGAAALGDIGEMFPDTDVANKGKDSTVMLSAAVARLHHAGWRVGNVDITVVTQRPKIGPHRAAIRARLAELLEVADSDVFVKGKTNELMGWIGREEGLAVMATATVLPRR
mgnify:CR=1 FL=1